MYANYYHLSDLPFTLGPNKHQPYLEEDQNKVLDYLNHCLDDDGISLLVGVASVGKSLLLSLFLQQLPPNKCAILVDHANLSVNDLYQQLAEGLSLNYHGQQTDLRSVVSQVKYQLLQLKARADNNQVILIIDNAEWLDETLLNEIRFLDNLDINGKKLLKIVLVGETSFCDSLQEAELTSLRQRVTTVFTVAPLTAQHSQNYLEQQLVYVDGSLDLFTPKALTLIIQKSKGIPRYLNLLAAQALVQNYVENESSDPWVKVDECHVKKAAEQLYCLKKSPFKVNSQIERDPIEKRPRSPILKGLGYIVLTLCVLSILLLSVVWSFVHYSAFYERYKSVPIVKQMFKYIPLSPVKVVSDDQSKLISNKAETVIQLSPPKEDLVIAHSAVALAASDAKAVVASTVNEVSASGTVLDQTSPISHATVAIASDQQSTPVSGAVDLSGQTSQATATEQTAVAKTTEQRAATETSESTEKPVVANSVIADNIIALDPNVDYLSVPVHRAYNIALFSIVAADVVPNPLNKMIDDLLSDDSFIDLKQLEREIKTKSSTPAAAAVTPSTSKSSPLSTAAPAVSSRSTILKSEPTTPAVTKKELDPIASVLDSVLNENSFLDVSDATSEGSSAQPALIKPQIQEKVKDPAITLDQLPPSVRKTLPSLHFQSHIYTPNFIYNWIKVNDKVVKEGEMITNSVQLIRIDPESTVIYFDSKMIRIPALATVDP